MINFNHFQSPGGLQQTHIQNVNSLRRAFALQPCPAGCPHPSVPPAQNTGRIPKISFPGLIPFNKMPSIKFHSGRTDGSFGHHVRNRPEGVMINVFNPASSRQTGDDKYHYHHGIGSHLHPNGVCPYKDTTTKVHISNPKAGAEFNVGDKLNIRATTSNTARVQLLINNALQEDKNGLIPGETVLFKPYTLTAKDFGETDITVVAYAANFDTEQSAVSTVKVKTAFKPVTSAQLQSFNWFNTSQAEADELNKNLQSYGIISPDSICLFLATCGQESQKGKRSLEYLNLDGTTVGGYPPGERGAGYIQITHASAHAAFLINKKSGPDPFSGSDTAAYIAENYPWEAAAWFWAETGAKKIIDATNPNGISINDYVAEYGSSPGVFLITQFYVNAGSSPFSEETQNGIRDGEMPWVIDIEDGRVKVNGAEIKLPNGWEDREKNYNAAIGIFK